MDDYNILRTQRLTRVETFCTENASDILPGSTIAALVAELKPVSQKLEKARVSQLRGPGGKKARIEALLIDFKDIARTSRAIGLDEPDFPVAAYRHPATAVETTVTTHADALLLLLEASPPIPRHRKPPRPPCAPSSSPTNSRRTSWKTSGRTATPWPPAMPPS